MIDFSITLKGTAPLLMHNIRLADPLDPSAKLVATAVARHKKSKSEADQIETRKQEFLGGLYWDADFGPFLPSENILQSLVGGGKKFRLGTKVRGAILFPKEVNPIAYNGPKTPEDLWEDANFRNSAAVVVGTARPIRTRPMFKQWAAQADGILDDTQLDWEQLVMVAEAAGATVGVGDWRPRYGRYEATIERTGK